MAWGWLFADSFDHYTSVADLDNKWALPSEGTALTGTGHAIAAGALDLPSGAAIRHTVQGQTAQVAMFCQVKRSSNNVRTLMGGYNRAAVAQNFTLKWRADGAFELFNNAGVSQGVSTFTVTDPDFHFVSLLVPIRASATVVLRVDGVTQRTWTAVETRANAVTTACDELWYGGNNAADTGTNYTIDNVVSRNAGAADTSAGIQTTNLIGSWVIEVGQPTGNGFVAESWSPGGGANWSRVDEVPYTPGGDEITRANSNGSDIYVFTPTRAVNRVYAVFPIIYGSKIGAGTVQVLVTRHTPSTDQTVASFDLALTNRMQAARLLINTTDSGSTPTDQDTFEYGPIATSMNAGETAKLGQFIVERVCDSLRPGSDWVVGFVGFEGAHGFA